MLPAGGSDLLALANPFSGGLIGIQVTASGLPRRWLLPDAGIAVSLVAGASEIFVPPCNRSDDFTLQCLVPQGASADLEVRLPDGRRRVLSLGASPIHGGQTTLG